MRSRILLKTAYNCLFRTSPDSATDPDRYRRWDGNMFEPNLQQDIFYICFIYVWNQTNASWPQASYGAPDLSARKYVIIRTQTTKQTSRAVPMPSPIDFGSVLGAQIEENLIKSEVRNCVIFGPRLLGVFLQIFAILDRFAKCHCDLGSPKIVKNR